MHGYSPALYLYVWRERGELMFCDPTTGRGIATLEDEREAAIKAEARADSAKARVRELEELLHRQSH